ncbi:uncharacterized protein [Gossypium hirsutum]|uniref:Retrovirus-related Pol polyprotein from transposon TNT 1-94-like beta-barrel domain-containing protein n=1 Tax=Gossypium hirsutum TaxID=3635 RepID=A0A1U8IIF6_GOSHI|nr:uncharacterized protein LOC107895391 [Gossypium hirsutum]
METVRQVPSPVRSSANRHRGPSPATAWLSGADTGGGAGGGRGQLALGAAAKELETVKQYSDRIMVVVNSIKLLGKQFSEARIVEKEQKKASRQEEHQEGAFQAKSKPTLSSSGYKGKKTWPDKSRRDGTRRRPDVQYNVCKQMGHVEKVCRKKGKYKQNQPQQPRTEAQVAEEGCDQEEQVFVVSCSTFKRKITKGWLIYSGCTNHMTPDAAIFKSIDRSFKTGVKVGNGQYIKAEGKGDLLIDTPSGTKLVSNVLFIPEIDRSLQSIVQLLEKAYSIVFKGKKYLISGPSGSKLMSAIMTDKSFVVD